MTATQALKLCSMAERAGFVMAGLLHGKENEHSARLDRGVRFPVAPPNVPDGIRRVVGPPWVTPRREWSGTSRW